MRASESVDADVGPFVEQGAVEAFDFAVGCGSVGAGAAVVDARAAAQRRCQARLR